jgi:hypothetical protein
MKQTRLWYKFTPQINVQQIKNNEVLPLFIPLCETS